MTLPTSGPLSLTDIQTEFGGTAPTSLSEYYAGGAYVPSGTSGTNGPVPTSGTISLASFYGTASVLSVNLSPTDLYTLSGAGTLTSAPVTATGSGGAGGYTYAWTFVSGSTYTVNSPYAATTTFTTTVSSGQLKTAVYRCTVTDSMSNTAYVDLPVDFEAF